jgi:Fe-S cluster assembly scaffold IscU
VVGALKTPTIPAFLNDTASNSFKHTATMAYSDKVLEHFKNPRNVGSMNKDAKNVGTGLVGAPECGDVMRLQIEVDEASGLIRDAKFKTFGCGSAIASSSLATEWLKGKSLDEAMGIDNMDIVEELALPPVKIHCSVLAEDAIKAAIQDYKSKNGIAVGEAELAH